MENMIEMRNAQFSESVMRSLNSVSQQLEQDETKYFLEEDIADLGVLYPNATNSDFSYTIPTSDGSSKLLIKGNLNSVKRYGPIDAVEEGRKIDAVIVAPQCPGGGWKPDKVHATLEWV